MDEDDAQTSNTCIAQRKRAITHSTMKTNGNVIEWCNNTQGSPRTGKHALALRTSVTTSRVTCLCSVSSMQLYQSKYLQQLPCHLCVNDLL